MKVLQRVGLGCQRFGSWLGPAPSIQELRVRRWRAVDGDSTLRLQYDLNPEAIVLDVGGFKGEWAIQIAGRYGCTIHVFEPIPEFAATIRALLSRNPKAHIHAFGLSGKSRTERISVNADRSSVFAGQQAGAEIQLVDIVEFLVSHGIEKVDLIKINIEGGEYELLGRLIDSGYISKITDIQVQFHDFVADAEQKMCALQQAMIRTHHLTYEFPFVWENWRQNTPADN
jgi:FkbM family methyltransferase